MNFQESVKLCLTKYADFKGTATRPEYWWFFLFVILVSAIVSTVSDKLGVVFSLAVLLPSIAAATRRLHDTGRSGWWQLVAVVPLVGFIVLLVFLAQPAGGPSASQGPAA